MSTSWTDWLDESLRDTERRCGFGAEGVKTSLAFALMEARESAGMTRAELAEASGVSEAYISKLESGDANPAVGKVGEIFAAMWMKPTVGFAPLMAERETDVDMDAIQTQPPMSANGAGAAGDESARAAETAPPRTRTGDGAGWGWGFDLGASQHSRRPNA